MLLASVRFQRSADELFAISLLPSGVRTLAGRNAAEAQPGDDGERSCSIPAVPSFQAQALPPSWMFYVTTARSRAGSDFDDDAAARLDKLDALLARTATTPEHAALIADLLSLPAGDRYPTLSLSPQQRKDKTLAALIRQLEALACELPILMVFEDAH